jgi:leader peptidase (prepilin peptidase)/N-methyltransferase
MDELARLEFFAAVIQTLFAGAFGACIGSLINVLVYRLPLGLSVVTPPSRCPKCETRLTWRENLPIIGWLMLRGRCRFCKLKISAEYPIVESIVALMFALFFVLWYVVPPHGAWPANQHYRLLGIDLAMIKPEWAYGGFVDSWACFIVLVVLLSSLVAMTIIDARTFTIPLVLAWFPTVVAVVLHPMFALYKQLARSPLDVTAPGEVWAIPTPGVYGWHTIGAAIGGVLGLAIANVLVSAGILKRSFGDYDAWEKSVREQEAAESAAEDSAPAAASEQAVVGDPEMWTQYPHARREMVREAAFLAPCAILAFAGWKIASMLSGPWTWDPVTGRMIAAQEAPLWLIVLGGVLWGYLIGGGIVWATRLLGSLAFGKEAMGLGDVHLMAAVGACLGWIDATLAFFMAAFLGLGAAVAGNIFRGKLARALPYGPFLAAATVVVLLAKPVLERALTIIFPAWAPINIP